VVALDQRGHGRSDAPEVGYELDTAVADLLAVIDALELERPVLAGQSWGGTVVLELASRRPDAVRGIACIDGGVVDLAQSYPVWEDCLAKLTPPTLDHLTLSELEGRIRKGVPHFSDRAVAAYLHCFRTRDDGTVEARLARSRHLSILRSLWEHRPSTRWAALKTPTLLLLADSGDQTRTTAKRRAEAAALAAGGKLRSIWFSPGHHDLHLEFPERIGDLLAAAVREDFFA
jgi:pimeloyl-ACP methyl ester carboxylesterase